MYQSKEVNILTNEVIYLSNEKKTSTWHGGTDGDYHCDNCDEAMLPSEIAYQNKENTSDAFCSILCLQIHARYNK